MGTTLGQYCINVSDLERSVEFYTDVLGLKLHSRTQIPGTNEALIWGGGPGSALQLAEHDDKTAPIDQSADGIKKVGAMWKLYVNTDDVKALHVKAIAAGAKSVVEPMHLEEWDVWISFVEDPDGYQIELVQGMDLEANAPS
ncbi:MAG: VOC family protein [bacterium]|nr:VOC family protein [bacterium]